MKDWLSKILAQVGVVSARQPVPARALARSASPAGGKQAVVVRTPARGGGGSGERGVAVRSENATAVAKSVYTPEMIASFAGRVVSAPGETCELSKGVRQFVAALDNGVVVYGKGHEVSPEVHEARGVLRSKGYVVATSVAVDLQLIRDVYEGHRVRFGGRALGDTTDMQEYLYRVVSKAYQVGATDIRIKALVDEGSIWMRRMGSYEQMEGGDIPAGVAQQLIRTAFNNAGVSDANHDELRTQSAQVTLGGDFRLPPGISGLRLEFAPLPLMGRLLAIRILPHSTSVQQDIDDFGYAPIHVAQIKRMRRYPAGMILISGPTGHGKSTTLKVCLEAVYRMHGGRKNIVTAEDPTEYTIANVSQIPVWKAKTTEERKEAFTDTIRSVLRLDPDIIMIGEIRDSAAAALGFKAAMSGHQVWSSIHTIDAISIPARLRDEGVEAYKLANPANLVGLVAQRLVRGICQNCRVPLTQVDTEDTRRQYGVLLDLVGPELAALACTGRPGGCDKCEGGGYVRRSAIAETILTDQRFMDLVNANDVAAAREYWLNELDGYTMKEHGLAKVLVGLVDPQDVEHEVGMLDLIDKRRVPAILGLAASIDPDFQKRARQPALIGEAAA